MGFPNKVRVGKVTLTQKQNQMGQVGQNGHTMYTFHITHTPQLIAHLRRDSMRQAAITNGNKHLNTCGFLQNMAPHKWESSGGKTHWKGSLTCQSSSVSTTSSSQARIQLIST